MSGAWISAANVEAIHQIILPDLALWTTNVSLTVAQDDKVKESPKYVRFSQQLVRYLIRYPPSNWLLSTLYSVWIDCINCITKNKMSAKTTAKVTWTSTYIFKVSIKQYSYFQIVYIACPAAQHCLLLIPTCDSFKKCGGRVYYVHATVFFFFFYSIYLLFCLPLFAAVTSTVPKRVIN